jgi:hypothetical protein
MKRPAAAFFFVFLTCPWLLPDAAAATIDGADYRRFLSWWAGDYDNLAQVAAQDAAGLPEHERNQATRLFIRRIDLPAFGQDVFYAEWQDARAPEKVTRQRIYAFRHDATAGTITLALHIWPADAAFAARTAGAHRDPAKLAGVSPADMAGLQGCDVVFDRVDDGAFVGAMVKGACAFDAPDGTPIYSWSQMRLTAGRFSYLDGWFNHDGTPFVRFTREWYAFDRTAPLP